MNPGRIAANTNTSGDLAWMPAARYSPFWPKMSAFALPSFYDGRVRINVVGREARGKIRASEYAETCQQIREVVSECRNLLTGKPVVSEVYCPKQNPHDVGPSEADVYIVWEGAPLGLSHPRLGNIGPLPYLRTGGHTGKYGFLNIVGGHIPAGQHVLPVRLTSCLLSSNSSGSPACPGSVAIHSSLLHVMDPGVDPAIEVSGRFDVE